MMGGGFCTIGHSNRDLGAFVDILWQAEVKTVADVRRFPRSRSNPAFNVDTLPDALARHQIGYCQFPDLGGRRKVQQDVPDTVNALWRNRSFHNYADYALSASFDRALRDLVDLGQRGLVTIMCSEAVWWRCHRRIITDYLLLRGFEVTHLMGAGRNESARLTSGAEPGPDDKLVYPASGAPGASVSRCDGSPMRRARS